MRCYECGVGEIVPTDIRGTTRRYRAHAKVPVTQSVIVRRCTHCGEDLLSSAEATALDAVLAPEYERLMRADMDASVGTLQQRTGAPKWIIEKLLHVSHGYLSKVVGDGSINPTFAVGLKALASAPTETLREVAENAGVADKLTFAETYLAPSPHAHVVAEGDARPYRKPTRKKSTRGAAKKAASDRASGRMASSRTASGRMDKKAMKVAAKLGRTRTGSSTTSKKTIGGKAQKKSAAKRSPGRVPG